MIVTRRDFLRTSLASGLGLIVAPTIVPASVLHSTAPSDRINIGVIGTGHDQQWRSINRNGDGHQRRTKVGAEEIGAFHAVC